MATMLTGSGGAYLIMTSADCGTDIVRIPAKNFKIVRSNNSGSCQRSSQSKLDLPRGLLPMPPMIFPSGLMEPAARSLQLVRPAFPCLSG
jgi:hypothetical protein